MKEVGWGINFSNTSQYRGVARQTEAIPILQYQTLNFTWITTIINTSKVWNYNCTVYTHHALPSNQKKTDRPIRLCISYVFMYVAWLSVRVFFFRSHFWPIELPHTSLWDVNKVIVAKKTQMKIQTNKKKFFVWWWLMDVFWLSRLCRTTTISLSWHIKLKFKHIYLPAVQGNNWWEWNSDEKCRKSAPQLFLWRSI